LWDETDRYRLPGCLNYLMAVAADDLGVTPAQLALGWLLQLATNVLLLARTGSAGHLRRIWQQNT
jgi:aryl-alcohol dehydrogenase-like predicted oxidoreductase